MNNHADCPLCGRELGIEVRAPGSRWSTRQDWLLLRLDDLGLSDKIIARVLRTSPNAIESRLGLIRRKVA